MFEFRFRNSFFGIHFSFHFISMLCIYMYMLFFFVGWHITNTFFFQLEHLLSGIAQFVIFDWNSVLTKKKERNEMNKNQPTTTTTKNRHTQRTKNLTVSFHYVVIVKWQQSWNFHAIRTGCFVKYYVRAMIGVIEYNKFVNRLKRADIEMIGDNAVKLVQHIGIRWSIIAEINIEMSNLPYYMVQPNWIKFTVSAHCMQLVVSARNLLEKGLQQYFTANVFVLLLLCIWCFARLFHLLFPSLFRNVRYYMWVV